MTDKKWKPEFAYRIYDLAKSGMTDATIAKTLGVSAITFVAWKKRKKEVTLALEQARKYKGQVARTETFMEYCAGRLAPDAKAVYDQVVAFDREANGQKRIEALLDKQGLRMRQMLTIHALIHSNFNASEACRKMCIQRSTFDAWCRKDPDFAELVDQIHTFKKDFFEEAFVNLIHAGDSSAIIHAAKTINADRGYGIKVDVKHTGTVDHRHELVEVADLETVPLEDRIRLLEAIRQRKADQQALPEHRGDVIEGEVVETKPAKRTKK